MNRMDIAGDKRGVPEYPVVRRSGEPEQVGWAIRLWVHGNRGVPRLIHLGDRWRQLFGHDFDQQQQSGGPISSRVAGLSEQSGGLHQHRAFSKERSGPVTLDRLPCRQAT